MKTLDRASEGSVNKANAISKGTTLKKLVDAFMSSVNKSNKSGVKNAADALISKCKEIFEELVKNKISSTIQDNDVQQFDKEYTEVLKELAESSDKKEKKLVTSMSNAFPHWCLKLAQKLQDSSFYKRLSDANNKNEDDGTAFNAEKKENNKGVMYKLTKKYKNLFSGKARKHETFNKIKNLVVRYSEPWAIAWVNAAEDGDPISESSAIKEINALCKKKDVDFIQNLGDEKNFKLAKSFTSIFGDNFGKNSGKIKKSLKSIIDRLVSISKKLDKGKYSEGDKEKISKTIDTYKNYDVFKEVAKEPGILSKVWGKLTAAASIVGKGIKTAEGKVSSVIAKGAKVVGKGALKVATSPKHLINKIYDKLKKIFPQKRKMNEIMGEISFDEKDDKNLMNMANNIDILNNNKNLNDEEKQKIILNNTNNLDNTSKFNKSIDSAEKENNNE